MKMERSNRKRLKASYHTEETGNGDTQREYNCGAIKSVTLKNFMCHDHLQVDFNPQINLLQGRNGSGKSAILTAVVIGLGGTTRVTNRGKNMKELIKYDKHTASVQIVVANNGKDAYKPETYGDSVIVERKISNSGSASFQIKNSSGTVVSTKKEDLKRICDFFSLNVENPLTVLNQDMSRSFLSSTDPRNLYKFFLEVTQLQIMCDYYGHLSDTLYTSNLLLQDRKECLPILEKEVNEAHSRYEFCLKHKEKRKTLSNLRRELAWATIIQHEKKCEAAENECSDVRNSGQKFEKAIEEQAVQLEKVQKEQGERKSQYFVFTKEMETRTNSVKIKQEAAAKLKENMKASQRQIDKLKRQVQTYQNEVTILRKAVKMDHSVAQQQWEEQHIKHLNMIHNLEIQNEELSHLMKTEETHLMNIQHTIKLKQDSLQQLNFEDMNKKRNIQELELELKNLQSQKTNAFTVFGQWVQPLLDKIETAHRQRRFKKKPIGPFGAYVEVLDSSWAHIAEKVIGRNISAFCVDNQEDARVLEDLFRTISFGNTEPSKIISRFRPRHDPRLISENEVRSSEYKSLWSILKITNDAVANILIDRYQVETTLLIPTAEEAGRILKNINTVPQNCKIAYTLRGDKYHPDPNFRVYSGQRNQRTRFLQISVEDKARAVQSDLKRLAYEKNKIFEELQSIREENLRLKAQEKESNQKLQKDRTKEKNIRNQLTELQGQEEPPPPNISQLEEDIRKEEANLATTEKELNDLQEQRKAKESEYKEASDAFHEAMENITVIKGKARGIEEEMQKLVQKEKEMKRVDGLLKQKLKNNQQKLTDLERKMKQAQETLQKETETASEFLPRKETDRSPEEIQKQYKYLAARLNKEEEQQGDPVEIMENYKKLVFNFKKMSAEHEDLSNLVKKLEDSLCDRQRKGSTFRKLLAVWVKASFTEALNIRNLVGKASFNFEKETLTLNVEKKSKGSMKDPIHISSQDKHGNQQQQVLSMMSGGERSFATVAFILALWEVIDSPVRILDEFDVFMDIVARRQSLDMMITSAKPNVQYIYLTPLEINKSQYSNKLNVFRMPDPDRNTAA